jgi:hypothetical protein
MVAAAHVDMVEYLLGQVFLPANFIVTSTMAALRFQTGVPPMATYMFVSISEFAADMSPPVALAAYAGGGLRERPCGRGGNAVKLALQVSRPLHYVFNPIPFLSGWCRGTALLAVGGGDLGIAFSHSVTGGKHPVCVSLGVQPLRSLLPYWLISSTEGEYLQFVLAIFTASTAYFSRNEYGGEYKVVMPSRMRALAWGAR